MTNRRIAKYTNNKNVDKKLKFNLDDLRPSLEEHPVVLHQFLRRFSEGMWSREAVRQWAEQQFYFSISLPSAFAALYARVPDSFWKYKHPLVSLLNVEAWGSRDVRCHSHYFLELADFLDLDISALTSREPKAYTKTYLDLRLEICLNVRRPIGQGLACIALGNELLNLHIYRAYRDGIHRIPGCEDCPMGYFDAHLSDEEADAQVFIDLFSEVVDNEEHFKAAEEGLEELLDARVVFFDALTKDLKNPCV